jgi:hypothetical protein
LKKEKRKQGFKKGAKEVKIKKVRVIKSFIS